LILSKAKFFDTIYSYSMAKIITIVNQKGQDVFCIYVAIGHLGEKIKMFFNGIFYFFS